MRWSLLSVCLFACAILEPKPTTGPGGMVEVTVSGPEIGGKRSAWVHEPSGGKKNLPVVLSFHGGKGLTGLDIAPQWKHLFGEPILFVFPNGDPDPKAPGWGGIGRGGDEGLKDVKFIEELIDELGRRYDIDKSRVYATGHSNGGQMTWNLACEIPHKLAGAAVVSKSAPKALVEVCKDPAKLPLIYFNGTADADTWKEGPNYLSAEDSMAWWTEKEGCSQKRTVELPDGGDRKTEVEKRVYDCPAPTAAEFFVIEGGGHPWPTQTLKAGGTTHTCRDIDASAEILRFFGL